MSKIINKDNKDNKLITLDNAYKDAGDKLFNIDNTEYWTIVVTTLSLNNNNNWEKGYLLDRECNLKIGEYLI